MTILFARWQQNTLSYSRKMRVKINCRWSAAWKTARWNSPSREATCTKQPTPSRPSTSIIRPLVSLIKQLRLGYFFFLSSCVMTPRNNLVAASACKREKRERGSAREGREENSRVGETEMETNIRQMQPWFSAASRRQHCAPPCSSRFSGSYCPRFPPAYCT